MRIHILADNRTRKRGFLAEHGLSIFIEHGNETILFDTGQSDLFCRNARNMGIDLSKTDHIIISHGHYDHSGGLIHFPRKGRFPKIYAHEEAFLAKYAKADGGHLRQVGIPWQLDDFSHIKDNMVFTRQKTQLAPDVFLCGEVPVEAAFEGAPGEFYVGDGSNRRADMLKDEQMLVIDTGDGLCIFLGCGHPGVPNCLIHALKMFPGKRINTLVAGMHLDGATPARLQKTIQAVLDLEIQTVIPLHCTGIFAVCELKRRLDDRCLALCAGDSLAL